jgi:hypothetical protein
LWTVAKGFPVWFFALGLFGGLCVAGSLLIEKVFPGKPASGGDGGWISQLWHFLPIPLRVGLCVAPLLSTKITNTILRVVSMYIEETAWVFSGTSLAVRVTLVVFLFVDITLLCYWWPAAAALLWVAMALLGSFGRCIEKKEQASERAQWG